MNSQNIMFIVLALLIAAGSVLTVTTKSIIRAATYLFFVLLGTAGLYFLMGYTFLGAVQVMVYAGGIIVLYVFSILLTSGRQEKLTASTWKKIGLSFLLALVGLASTLLILLTSHFKHTILTAPIENAEDVIGVEQVGRTLLSSGEGGYLLPFEAVSLLLLACIVSALVVARKR